MTSSPLSRLADHTACITFVLAHVVTIMFYGIWLALGRKSVDSAANLNHPQWLSPTKHILNRSVSQLVNTPLIFRSPFLPCHFLKRRCVVGFDGQQQPQLQRCRLPRLLYIGNFVHRLDPHMQRGECNIKGYSIEPDADSCQMHILSVTLQMNGSFPYPFLNTLPFPEGFVVTAMSSVCVFACMFRVGSAVNAAIKIARGDPAPARPEKEKLSPIKEEKEREEKEKEE